MNNGSAGRLTSLDAARGLAMLLVCVAHFLDIFFYAPKMTPPDAWWVDLVMMVCRSAAPTFFVVSGVLLGYQAEIRGAQFGVFRLHLFDRALFLATIGHLLIALSMTARVGFARAVTTAYVTDTLAFCVIIGALLASAMGWRLRLLLGIGLSMGNWLAWVFWVPEEPFWQIFKNAAVGPTSPDQIFWWFPLAPWLGVYLAGSAFGSGLAKNDADGLRPFRRRFIAVALAMVAAAVGVKAASMLWASLSGAPLPLWIYQEVSPFQKYPPGPFYVLFYGGIALLLLKVLRTGNQPSWFRQCVSLMEPIGRSALPVFVALYFVYYTVLYVLISGEDVAHASAVAAVFLPLSLVSLWGFAMLCQRYRVSRYLTTGLPRIMSPSPRQIAQDGPTMSRRASWHGIPEESN